MFSIGFPDADLSSFKVFCIVVRVLLSLRLLCVPSTLLRLLRQLRGLGGFDIPTISVNLSMFSSIKVAS